MDMETAKLGLEPSAGKAFEPGQRGLFNGGAVENNASGESGASAEAISRSSQEKAAGQARFRVDADGNMTPLRSVTDVDAKAPKGSIIIQKGIGSEPFTILDRGGLPASHAKGLLNRALAGKNSPPLGDLLGEGAGG